MIMLTIMFMVGLWDIDVASSAITLNLHLDNLLGHEMVDPNTAYHGGLLLSTVAFLGVIIIAIFSPEYDLRKSKRQ